MNEIVWFIAFGMGILLGGVLSGLVLRARRAQALAEAATKSQVELAGLGERLNSREQELQEQGRLQAELQRELETSRAQLSETMSLKAAALEKALRIPDLEQQILKRESHPSNPRGSSLFRWELPAEKQAAAVFDLLIRPADR